MCMVRSRATSILIAAFIISVTESAGRIWAGLARRYGPCLVLLEHHPAPESGEGMETLDLVRIGADGSPHWSRVWPTRRRTRVTPGWNCGWPVTGTRSSAGPRAGSMGVTTLTADCSWRPRDVVRPGGSGGGERAPPGMAEARSRGPRAWPLADRPRPAPRRTGTAVGGALAACAAVCAAVIAAVMASRDVTA